MINKQISEVQKAQVPVFSTNFSFFKGKSLKFNAYLIPSIFRIQHAFRSPSRASPGPGILVELKSKENVTNHGRFYRRLKDILGQNTRHAGFSITLLSLGLF